MEKPRAIVLLSGGIDSATTAAYAAQEGYELYAMTFVYGQRHSIEISCAKDIVKFLNIRTHIIINIPSGIFSKSALLSESAVPVPKGRNINNTNEIPDTYVPARNIIFLSYALAYAETVCAMDIFIGANAVDYSGYPDCRPEFFKSYENMANIGTRAGLDGNGFRIQTPLLLMKKSDIIKLGAGLGMDYSLTHSCYDPDEDGSSCGECDSCIIRMSGFSEAGVPDPTKYRKG
jgi:7-cyano-7-deazaguanine synthase